MDFQFGQLFFWLWRWVMTFKLHTGPETKSSSLKLFFATVIYFVDMKSFTIFFYNPFYDCKVNSDSLSFLILNFLSKFIIWYEFFNILCLFKEPTFGFLGLYYSNFHFTDFCSNFYYFLSLGCFRLKLLFFL